MLRPPASNAEKRNKGRQCQDQKQDQGQEYLGSTCVVSGGVAPALLGDPDGSERAWVKGIVPACLPQTAQASEFCAAAYAGQACVAPSILHDDCLNVVKAFSRPREAWGDERAIYAGCMRQAFVSDVAGNLSSIEKVKSHQNMRTLTWPCATRFSHGATIAQIATRTRQKGSTRLPPRMFVRMCVFMQSLVLLIEQNIRFLAHNF